MMFAPKWAREPHRGPFGYPLDVLSVVPRSMGWPLLVDRRGRSTDVHWLISTRAWQRSLGYLTYGDTIVVVGHGVWPLRRAARRYLCTQCAAPHLLPGDHAHGDWARLVFRICAEGMRLGTPVCELILAADHAVDLAAAHHDLGTTGSHHA